MGADDERLARAKWVLADWRALSEAMEGQPDEPTRPREGGPLGATPVCLFHTWVEQPDGEHRVCAICGMVVPSRIE